MARSIATLSQQVHIKDLIEANSKLTGKTIDSFAVREFNDGWDVDKIAQTASTPERPLNSNHVRTVLNEFKWYFMGPAKPLPPIVAAAMQRIDEIETTVIQLMENQQATATALGDFGKRLDALEAAKPARPPLTVNSTFEEWALQVDLESVTVPTRNFVSWYRVQEGGMAVRSATELRRYINSQKGGLPRKTASDLLAQSEVAWGEFIKFRSGK